MKNKGISLIMLVITIIVIIILAGAVILSIVNNNPIGQASEAKFKTAVDAYNSELSLAISNEYLGRHSFDTNDFDRGPWDGNEDNIDGTIKEYIKSLRPEDGQKFKIENGKLVYTGEEQTEKDWIVDLGFTNASALAVNTIATKNSTINGATPKYSNPIIPAGFKAINDGAVWPTDWNKGLVIENASGNQFVWVPVDNTNVKYEKWDGDVTFEIIADTSDDSLPAGITSEIEQINKYGGFYVSRYEAGKESTSTLVSKKNSPVWNYITYNNAKLAAESMIVSEFVKTGLITGTQWDTTMKWIQNDNVNVSNNSSSWGNYSNSVSPANVSGFGSLQSLGYSEYWKAKNIYDLAGNAWEWTNEIFQSNRVRRGGHFATNAASYPAMFRNTNLPTESFSHTSFRTVLYVL